MALETILTDIEDAIEQRLRAIGLQEYVTYSDMADDSAALRLPAVNVAFREMDFPARVTDTVVRASAIIGVTIMVENLVNDHERRNQAYPLVLGALSILCRHKLSVTRGAQTTELACRRLNPKRVSQVLDQYPRISYVLELTADFTVQCSTEEDAETFVTAALQYFLKPGDDIADASDTVEVNPPPEP
jgi:hypothetical protein